MRLLKQLVFFAITWPMNETKNKTPTKTTLYLDLLSQRLMSSFSSKVVTLLLPYVNPWYLNKEVLWPPFLSYTKWDIKKFK